jgi:hypothetical protein
VSNIITNALINVSLVLYIKFYLQDSWGGWSSQGLTHISQFIKLGIPGVFMICAGKSHCGCRCRLV